MPPFTFTLEKQAKNTGGDKYVCDTDAAFNIYIPQSVSRINGDVQKTLIITISESQSQSN